MLHFVIFIKYLLNGVLTFCSLLTHRSTGSAYIRSGWKKSPNFTTNSYSCSHIFHILEGRTFLKENKLIIKTFCRVQRISNQLLFFPCGLSWFCFFWFRRSNTEKRNLQRERLGMRSCLIPSYKQLRHLWTKNARLQYK